MIDRSRLLSETFIRDVEWFETIGSTNTFALHLTRLVGDLPVLVGTEHQSQGRGRGNNSWWACSGSLTFSLLISPASFRLSPAQWPLLSLATGLAVCQALESEPPHIDLRLKWPNDVFADGKKLCGILLEGHPTQSEQLVIGIGLNVNNSLAHAPDEVRQRATSLCDLRTAPWDRTEVLISILKALAAQFQALGDDSLQFAEQFRQRCYLSGRIVTIKEAQGEVTGCCQGIDDDGALRLMTELGPRRVLAGVITAIGD
ncbi:biotin--[acetyl-CoA-carboxylase] ligase [Planctomicrobium piriforme]|uniref:biotin--[biotin carboxyl-carrier protein] ligase n=1 Tax=Planctomicrobium piriforme TaxID=1576369 RepID=A0A1I3NP45_9PLAN|nr:biotin--[acetyl-CoA-carboxylase] ligase [Planctomicrobium piriforme]SFJ11044.1 BirA family transcriptional regulator, biotin operon repressor / biotin-[acetyl-CoA-carboxylase] ligase [Planctomicrobium piriforme]